MGSGIIEKQTPRSWKKKYSKYQEIREGTSVLFQRFEETLLSLIEREFGITRLQLAGSSKGREIYTCRKVFVYVTLAYFPDTKSLIIGAFIDKNFDCVNNILKEIYPIKEGIVKKHPEDFMEKISRIRSLLSNISIAEIVVRRNLYVTPEMFYEAGVDAGFSDDEILRFSVKLF